MARSYSQEEIQHILQLTMARRFNNQGTFSRQQLVEMATELGISTEELESVEQEWAAQQDRGGVMQPNTLAYRRARLNRNVITYLIVNVFVVLLNFSTTGGLSWSLYLLIGWGIALAIEARSVFQTEASQHSTARRNRDRNRNRTQ